MRGGLRSSPTQLGVLMTDIINFNGSVWGATTKGTVFMEMLRTGNHIEGRLCVMEPGLGQLNALFVGEWSAENRIRVTINQFTGAYNVPVTLPQTGRMDGTFDPTEGVVNGTWSTDAQTSGKVLLVKTESQQQVVQQAPAAPAGGASLPVAPATPVVQTNAAVPPLITKTVVLGSYRLDERAVRRLVGFMKRGTNVGRAAVVAAPWHRGCVRVCAAPAAHVLMAIGCEHEGISQGSEVRVVREKCRLVARAVRSRLDCVGGILDSAVHGALNAEIPSVSQQHHSGRSSHGHRTSGFGCRVLPTGVECWGNHRRCAAAVRHS